jgi:hypothetical protein
VPLLSEIFGALAAGALMIVIARQLGLESRRAFGAVALVAVSVATALAVPTLRQDVSALLSQRKEYVGLSSAEAQVEQGAKFGVNVDFLAWADEHLGEGETFHMEIGQVPGEPEFEGGGIFEGTTFAWATYQLAPHLSVDQSVGPNGIEPGEGGIADWIVFYSMNPKEYPGSLGKVFTYEPNFAIARNALAS